MTELRDNQKQIGTMLKGYRKRRGFDRKKVILLAGNIFTLNRLSSIENGRGKFIKAKEIEALYTKCFLIPLEPFRDILVTTDHTDEDWKEYRYKLDCARLNIPYKKNRRKKARRKKRRAS